jgi:hypothetical protein
LPVVPTSFVDVCKGHGTWFDRDELRRIVEFIRSGGLELAREKELAELEERRRELRAAERSSAFDAAEYRRPSYGQTGLAVGAAAALLKLFR